MRVIDLEDKRGVIVLKISEADLAGMLLKYDLADDSDYKYMDIDFVDAVRNYLPEYAMGEEERPGDLRDYIPYIQKVAKTVLKIPEVELIGGYLKNSIPYSEWDPAVLKKYECKGLFSELILHFLLREFFHTEALISKIYFKDSFSHEAHGFDAVHVTGDGKLWLGETKFYKDCKGGLNELISDLYNHFNHDYLNEQIYIINRSLTHQNNRKEEWIKRISNASRLCDIFDMVMIPLLCIYEDEMPEKYLDAIKKGLNADDIYCNHIEGMKNYFDNHNTFPNKSNINTLLILLPVESKDRIVTKILERIYNMQGI